VQHAGQLPLAKAWLFLVLSIDGCRDRKPRNLSRCGDCPLVIAKVPVKNLACRIYRDHEIAVMLQYDAQDRLARDEVEMQPYKTLPIPMTKVAIHWARRVVTPRKIPWLQTSEERRKSARDP
jgi:hypothetical protein